jgi:transposase
VDATGCTGCAQDAPPGGVPSCGAASLLLGIPGLAVTAVTHDDGGWTTVDVATAPELREQARLCPGCGVRAAIKEWVTTTPRDLPLGDREVRARWRKMRLACGNTGCPVGTFTEWLPAVQPRARLTARLRTRIGAAIGDDLMPAATAARRYGVSDRTATAAFTAYADQQLADLRENREPVEAAGIDEFRRGIPGPARGGQDARSEWFTHLVDLGDGGTLGLAQERTGDAGKSLVKDHEGTLRYLAMDLSAPYRSAVPDGARIIADAFHLVKLANRKIDDTFRRLSYRTEHPHEELGLPRPLHYMLRHNIETISPEHLDIIIETLDGDADGQQIAAVWIAKEQLRALLALRATRTRVTPAPSAVRDKLADFYLWCADNTDVPEIKTLANTIEKWQQPVIDAVLTGYSNAKAEAHNRTAKLVARTARGFASPENQDRRVRMATTRKARLARSKQPRRLRLRRRSRSAARPP